jgi:cytidylate kinase
MTLPRIIAVDGPAGAGKTSVCSAVARDLGYLFVDTGAFYRAVTYGAVRVGVVETEPDVVRVAEASTFDISKDGLDDEEYTIWLNGEDITEAVRSPEVEKYVSPVAAMAGVRDVLNRKYREFAAARERVIMAGRDIGTVVLPDADLKIYLDASPEVRAQRRTMQRLLAGQSANYDDILKGIKDRDRIDSTRIIAPLIRPLDAVYINSDRMELAQVVDAIRQLILRWQPGSSPHEADA